MNENSMTQKDKTLYIIAGANGSGKTTFALRYTALNELHFINADDYEMVANQDDVFVEYLYENFLKDIK